jgi:hypothetical protein
LVPFVVPPPFAPQGGLSRLGPTTALWRAKPLRNNGRNPEPATFDSRFHRSAQGCHLGGPATTFAARTSLSAYRNVSSTCPRHSRSILNWKAIVAHNEWGVNRRVRAVVYPFRLKFSVPASPAPAAGTPLRRRLNPTATFKKAPLGLQNLGPKGLED